MLLLPLASLLCCSFRVWTKQFTVGSNDRIVKRVSSSIPLELIVPLLAVEVAILSFPLLVVQQTAPSSKVTHLNTELL